MSYCVNCGVELDKSAKKCALCSTPVINPSELEHYITSPAPYSDKVVLPPGVRRRYVAFLLSMAVLIPNIVCGIINFLLPDTGHWAVYVISSSALVWVLFIQPFLWKKAYPYSIIAIDTVAAAFYIYVFYAVGSAKGWFYDIALPLLLLMAAILMFMAYWLKKKKRDWPVITIALLTEISIVSICADLLLHMFFFGRFTITVSLIITASCLALIGFFISVTRNKRLRAWLGRKFFI